MRKEQTPVSKIRTAHFAQPTAACNQMSARRKSHSALIDRACPLSLWRVLTNPLKMIVIKSGSGTRARRSEMLVDRRFHSQPCISATRCSEGKSGTNHSHIFGQAQPYFKLYAKCLKTPLFQLHFHISSDLWRGLAPKGLKTWFEPKCCPYLRFESQRHSSRLMNFLLEHSVSNFGRSSIWIHGTVI